MKHSNLLSKLSIVDISAFIIPLLLIAPNIALDITEPMTWYAKLFNIAAPFSFYCVCFSLTRNTPLVTLLLIPAMIFAAFQIVLLYLYGSSIIGVDMFLNLVTTNVSEACELLGNLFAAILTILIIYLPAIITGIVGIVKGWKLKGYLLKPYRKVSLTIFIITVIGILITPSSYSVTDDLFPVNVVKNLCLAFQRNGLVRNYHKTSDSFSYNATSTRDTELPETYIMVIGETSRAENWQIGGYERPTNPQLSKINNLTYFSRALTQSNTTHKSVPMIMSSLEAETFDSINYRKSIITAFKEAGFHTSFFSNQSRNRSYTEFFSNEADTVVYLSDANMAHHYDGELIGLAEKIVNDSTHRKKLIILHTYGSHFNYHDRYPSDFSVFSPDNIISANSGNRSNLVNAYDNTILYVDYVLSSLIKILENSGYASALIYSSDHGEDIFDDYRGRFLHSSPTPTYHQLHVPMIAWTSARLDSINPEFKINLTRNSGQVVSPSISMFHSMIDVAGINTPAFDSRNSIMSKSFTEPPLMYVDDRNFAVHVTDCGLKEIDIENLKKLVLSQRLYHTNQDKVFQNK